MPLGRWDADSGYSNTAVTAIEQSHVSSEETILYYTSKLCIRDVPIFRYGIGLTADFDNLSKISTTNFCIINIDSDNHV